MKLKKVVLLALGLLSTGAFAAVGTEVVLQGSTGSTAEKIYNLLPDGEHSPAVRTGTQIECSVIHSLVPTGQEATPFYTCKFFVHSGGDISINPGL